MSKALQRILVILGIALGTLALFFVGISSLLDLNLYKNRVEAAVANATGLELKVYGKASLRLFPHVHITANDVHLYDRGTEFFSAKQVQVSPQLGTLIREQKLVVNQLALRSPKITIEKPIRIRSRSSGTSTYLQLRRVKITDGELAYHEPGRHLEFDGLKADLSEISLAGNAAGFQKSLSFQGHFEMKSFKTKDFEATDVRGGVRAEDGLFQLDPIEAQVFRGSFHGNAQVDLRSPTPRLNLAQTASHIELGEIPDLKAKGVSGPVDFSLELKASGNSPSSLLRTADGKISLTSQDIDVTGIDVDALAAKLKFAQGMALVSIGSAIASGPLVGVTHPSGTSEHQNSNVKSVIHHLVSEWHISQGIAQATNVAFSTEKTTVAFKGGIDLIRKTYRNFRVATVDSQGCAKNEVQVAGPLGHPHPLGGSMGQQLSESFLGSAERDFVKIFGANGCDQFYRAG